MASSSWAISQIAQILPLDEESLQEILDYSSTLSKDNSAEHLRNLLGTSPKALEFISSFNARREPPKTQSRPPTPEGPESSRKPRKKKQPLNKPFNPRQPEDYGNTGGGYQKKNDGDYMSGRTKQHKEPALANALALSDKPDARQLPIPAPVSGSSSPKKPPSAIGPLISDLPNVRTGSRTNSRTSSPAPRTKVNVAGGAAMHGASSTLQDLVRISFTSLLHIQNQLHRLRLCLLGLRHPRPRDPNQSLPYQRTHRLPRLLLQCNPPPSPRGGSQLSQLRQDHLRQRGHWPMHILLATPTSGRRDRCHDPLIEGRKGQGENACE